MRFDAMSWDGQLGGRVAVRVFAMIKLLQQVLNAKSLKRLALILLLLASGAMASRYLAHYLRPAADPYFTVHASP
jgi:hypothetical protein